MSETDKNRLRRRVERFKVEDDHLIRNVTPRRGEPYEHSCPRASFEQVAHAIDELGDETFTLETLAEGEDLPFTQVAVALAFLKERGIVETRCRRPGRPACGTSAASPRRRLDTVTARR